LDRSPGFALTLLAESTTTAIHSAEAISSPGAAPEDVAKAAVMDLLDAVARGGCIDTMHQSLVLLYMVLGSEDVGRVRMSEPTERT
jgi:RNA 3'-terminal phosphate cyclase-like protein